MQRLDFTIELPREPVAILERLRQAGFEAYAVGGAVRDALLGQSPQETDIATSATPTEVAALFPQTHDVGAAFGVMLVVEDGVPVEVATFREESAYADGRHPTSVRFTDIDTDVLRRDFTINGLYYDAARKQIVDAVGGIEDLRAGTLRSIGDATVRFGEDHLRMLRAVRFAARLDLVIESDTWLALQEEAAKIGKVSAERVRDELEKILVGPRPGMALRALLFSGLLQHVLPEIDAMFGVAQPPQYHPEGDVFTHTCMVLEAVEPRHRVLAWGALLHDVGKPPTFRVAERIRFDGHVSVGVTMARELLDRLRVDRVTIERVSELVRLHLKFADAKAMRPSTLKRFLRAPFFEEHLALHRADCLGSHRDLSLYEFCKEQASLVSEEQLRPPALLKGQDLIELGYPAGPLFGEILDAVEDAQLEGTLTSREDAIQFVTGRWPRNLA